MPYAEVNDFRMYYAFCWLFAYRLPDRVGRTTQPQQVQATGPARRTALLRRDRTHPKRAKLHIDTGQGNNRLWEVGPLPEEPYAE